MSEFGKLCTVFFCGLFLGPVICLWIDDFIEWHNSKWKRR